MIFVICALVLLFFIVAFSRNEKCPECGSEIKEYDDKTDYCVNEKCKYFKKYKNYSNYK